MKKTIMILLISTLSLLACPNNPACAKQSCNKEACKMKMKACPHKGEGKMNSKKKENCHSQDKSSCSCEIKCACEGKQSCDCQDDCACPKCKMKK